MTVEEHVQDTLGRLMIQLAQMQAALDQKDEKIAAMDLIVAKLRKDKTDGRPPNET